MPTAVSPVFLDYLPSNMLLSALRKMDGASLNYFHRTTHWISQFLFSNKKRLKIRVPWRNLHYRDGALCVQSFKKNTRVYLPENRKDLQYVLFSGELVLHEIQEKNIPDVLEVCTNLNCTNLVFDFCPQDVIQRVLSRIRPEKITVYVANLYEKIDYDSSLLASPAFSSAKNLVLCNFTNIDTGFMRREQEVFFHLPDVKEPLKKILRGIREGSVEPCHYMVVSHLDHSLVPVEPVQYSLNRDVTRENYKELFQGLDAKLEWSRATHSRSELRTVRRRELSSNWSSDNIFLYSIRLPKGFLAVSLVFLPHLHATLRTFPSRKLMMEAFRKNGHRLRKFI